MYVVSIPNRNSPPAILLRESYREEGKVRNRTLANISDWSPARIEMLRRTLRGELPPQAPGEILPARLEDAFDIVRSRPHGHVAAVLSALRQTGLDRLLSVQATRARQICIALIAARIIDPCSKLATAQALDPETCGHTLGELLDLGSVDEDDLYEAMDWLLLQQVRIEDGLAKRHLADGRLVLYDVSSTYFEGHTCPLGKHGHSRDGKKDKLQIVFGLLTSSDGCPVSVEVFEGNVGDPKTLASQVQKLRERFGLKRVVLVGDRGMITDARIREDLSGEEGIAWITALRAPAIANLVEEKAIQPSLFDTRDLAEITSPSYPKQRLVVCKNPFLAAERARKRQELLAATEKDLRKIVEAVARPKRRLRGKDKIGVRVGKVLGRFKVGKHFKLDIGEETFTFQLDEESVSQEAVLDGIYVVRTMVPSTELDSIAVVRAYKGLAAAERAFRSLKTIELNIRPIHHRKADRVRAHVFLCMLSYYVEWHMRRSLATLLFDDDDKAAGDALRSSIVAPAQRSPKALRKAERKRTDDDMPVQSFVSLLRNLATIVKNRIQPKACADTDAAFDIITRPTTHQRQALQLLKVKL